MPKKQQNKGPKRKATPTPAVKQEVFVYTSKCCGVRAVKPALVKTPEAEGTLGKFRCGGCGKRTPVFRNKAVQKTQEVNNG
jgi:hypothetical protein